MNTFDTFNSFIFYKKRLFCHWEKIWLINIERFCFQKVFVVLIGIWIGCIFKILVVNVFFISEKIIIFGGYVTLLIKVIWNLSVLVIKLFDLFKLSLELDHFWSSKRLSHGVFIAECFNATSAQNDWDLIYLSEMSIKTITTDKMITVQNGKLDGFLLTCETREIHVHQLMTMVKVKKGIWEVKNWI